MTGSTLFSQSVRQPYIVDAARPPFVENEMDHEFLRQHVQLATVRVGQGNEARTLLAREGAWPGDHGRSSPFRSRSDGSV